MSCCPSVTRPYAAVVADMESGDVVLFDNDQCALSGCFCCNCCSSSTCCFGIDANNACCARAWHEAAIVLVNSNGVVYALEFATPNPLNTPTPPENRRPPTPRDALTNEVIDTGFRLVPLLFLMRRAAERGAYVHAHRKLYVAESAKRRTLARRLRQEMERLQRDATAITVLQVEMLRKQGGPPSTSGVVREADRRLFAATNSGYLAFYMLRRLGLVVPKKLEKYYDVEDLLDGGDIETALQGATLGQEMGFFFAEPKPPPAVQMV